MKLSLSLTVVFIGYLLCICSVCVIGRAGQANRPNIDVLTNGIADSENNLETDPRVIKTVKRGENILNGLQRKISKRDFREVVITPHVDILLYLDELTGPLSVSHYCEVFRPQGHPNRNWAIWTVQDWNLAGPDFRVMIQTQHIGWQCLGHEEQIVRLTSCSTDDSVWQNPNNKLCHNQECLATDGSNVYLENMDTPKSSYSIFFQLIPTSTLSVQFTQDNCGKEKSG